MLIPLLFLSLGWFAPKSNYTQTVNAGEIALANGQYKHAVRLYDSAFAMQAVPLAQDLYNASVCALQLDELEKSMSYCLLLADKGVSAGFFIKKTCYHRLKKSKNWAGFIREARSRQRGFQKRNVQSLRFMSALLDKSDAVYNEYYTKGQSAVALKEFKWTSDSLSKIILNYLENNGYPSEEQFGVAVTKDTLLDAKPVFYRLMYRRPILVNVHLDSLFTRLFYQKGVNEGKLKPEQAVEMMRERLHFQQELATHFYTLYGKNLYGSSQISEAVANNIRKLLGLISLEDELVKIKSSIPTKANCFLFSVFLTQQRAPNEPQQYVDEFLKANTLIIENIAPDSP